MNTPRNPHPATAISRGPLKSALPAHVLDEIKELPARYPQPRSAVMPALDLAQEELGHLTPEAMSEVAAALQLDPGYVEGVATFYSLFHLQPIGKHRFYVCTNLSCMLRGANEIVDHLKQGIGVTEPGQVSADGMFSYEEVECLGACEFAPMMRFEHRYHYDLTSAKIDDLIAEQRRGPDAIPHPGPPQQVGRVAEPRAYGPPQRVGRVAEPRASGPRQRVGRVAEPRASGPPQPAGKVAKPRAPRKKKADA